MEREIKFRGQTKDGKWLRGNLVDAKVMTSILSEKDISSMPLDGIGIYLVQNEVKKETIGQYTGMKDKNGNDIYEGDILKHGESDSTYIAEWVQDTGHWRATALTALHHNALPYITDDSLIIGNIHDNPELMI